MSVVSNTVDVARRRLDVLGLGCTAVDELLYVQAIPPADGKARVLRSERQCGGLTATALVAASRLGARCAFAGMLGEDDLSHFVEATLVREGIETATIVRDSAAAPVHSRIAVAADGARTIYFQFGTLLGAHDTRPDEATLASARVIFIDQYGMKGNLRAATIARKNGVAIVADMEDDSDPLFGQVLAAVDHLVLSQDFALHLTRANNASDAAKALWAAGRKAVVVTCGANGCWYLDEGMAGNPQHQKAFAVEVVDTTGCGDVFHGAYATAVARGMALPERIRFASAAAAMKATRPGGQTGIPTLSQLQEFLKTAQLR